MRAIDADALWMEIIHRMDYCDDILEIIESMPTIEPERKKGEWINVTNDESLMEEYECSICKYELFYSNPTSYCSNCGADMRKAGDAE